MKVAIGSDHRGIRQRACVAEAIDSLQFHVLDEGTNSTESCDYPDIAAEVSAKVASGEADRGILICGTGIGMSIAANKFRGIRAAVCHDINTTELSRQHNNANVLCLPGSIPPDMIQEMVRTWLTTDFEGGRHLRRVEKVIAIENEQIASSG